MSDIKVPQIIIDLVENFKENDSLEWTKLMNNYKSFVKKFIVCDIIK